jgi:hypothetical protein
MCHQNREKVGAVVIDDCDTSKDDGRTHGISIATRRTPSNLVKFATFNVHDRTKGPAALCSRSLEQTYAGMLKGNPKADFHTALVTEVERHTASLDWSVDRSKWTRMACEADPDDSEDGSNTASHNLSAGGSFGAKSCGTSMKSSTRVRNADNERSRERAEEHHKRFRGGEPAPEPSLGGSPRGGDSGGVGVNKGEMIISILHEMDDEDRKTFLVALMNMSKHFSPNPSQNVPEPSGKDDKDDVLPTSPVDSDEDMGTSVPPLEAAPAAPAKAPPPGPVAKARPQFAAAPEPLGAPTQAPPAAAPPATVAVPKPPPSDFVGRGEWRGDQWVVFAQPAPQAVLVAVPKPPPSDFVGRGEWRGDQWFVFAQPAPQAAPAAVVMQLPPLLQLQTAMSPVDSMELSELGPPELAEYQGRVCPWCGKQDGVSHRSGKQHQERKKEAADLTRLAGVAARPRSLASLSLKPLYTPRGRVPSKAEMKAHWGNSLELLPERAMARCRRSGGIKLGKHLIPPGAVRRLHLAVVSYSGTGKYSESNRLLRWTELPDQAPQAPPELPVPAPPAFPAPPVQEFDWGNLPFGDGWWPVTIIEWQVEGEFQAWRYLVTHAVTGGVAIVCIYQWGWPEPTAWWCTLER